MPNLFTKVKDRARAAAQPKPRTTHQVRGQVDTPFLLLTVLLVVVGLVMLLSASYPTAYYDIKDLTDGDAFYYFKRQALFAVLGLVVMYLVSKVNYQRKSDNITAQLVRKILSVERVDHIQQQVMRKQIIPRY